MWDAPHLWVDLYWLVLEVHSLDLVRAVYYALSRGFPHHSSSCMDNLHASCCVATQKKHQRHSDSKPGKSNRLPLPTFTP